MNQVVLTLCLLMIVMTSAPAQVTVEITQEQDQFLPGEAILTAVRITNRSGQTLRLGAEDNWLTFEVASGDREVVPKTGDVPVKGEFQLASSKVATKRVDLSPYFSASTPGSYTVTATLRIKDWDREITSPPRKFEIIQGASLWEQEIGVPGTTGSTNSTPEVRRYILQQAHYLKNQLRLYLRLTDATGARVYKVFPIGPTVSFGQPQPQVDRASNLHVLYQDRPHAFSYTVFNPDGELVLRQTYDIITTRPRLQPDGDGKILVVGGSRRVTPSDVPTPRPEELPGAGPQAPIPLPETKPSKH